MNLNESCLACGEPLDPDGYGIATCCLHAQLEWSEFKDKRIAELEGEVERCGNRIVELNGRLNEMAGSSAERLVNEVDSLRRDFDRMNRLCLERNAEIDKLKGLLRRVKPFIVPDDSWLALEIDEATKE